MNDAPGRWRYTLAGAASVAVLLAVWALVTGTGLVRRTVLPAPWDLWNAFLALARDGYADKPLSRHVVASITRTLTGFLLALVLGIPAGLLVGWNRWIAAIFSPILAFVRPIPPIAFVPLFILYFGIGETAKILVIFLVAFWYMVLNASAGVAGVSHEWVRAGLNLGLTRRQLFTSVILPAALPQILTGVKTAIAVSWALVVAAELIAAQEGIGHIIMDAATFNRTRDVFVGIIMIGLIGFGLERVVSLIEARMLHWQGR